LRPWFARHCDSDRQHSEEGQAKAPDAVRRYLHASASRELTDFMSVDR